MGMGRKLAGAALVAVSVACGAQAAVAQSSSLFGPVASQRGMTLADCSWTHQPLPPRKEVRLHDQLTVIVKLSSAVSSEGEMDRRKKAKVDAVLKEWIKLDGLSLLPAPQTNGDPAIEGTLENQFRAEADMQTRDSMTFSIAVNVADIRPNGLLVIEGRQTIEHNGDRWERCLRGLIRPEDIMPNNTVQSESIAELEISKRETGHIQDGYRRGWLLEALDKVQPF